MNRRTFVRASAFAAALVPAGLLGAESPPASPAATVAAPARRRPNRKGFMLAMLNSPTARALPLRERFALVRAAGFEGVEVNSGLTPANVLAARDAAGLAIPSVVVGSHWTHSLSDPNPATRDLAVAALEQALRHAKAYGAQSVLLVPAIVKPQVSYADAWQRAVDGIRRALPLAEELGVAIAIENVWNHFLLSPLEAVRFVDAFESPWVRWHLDVGNVVNFGWPEHWVRSLGKRIVQLHVKEYSRALRDRQGPMAGFQADLQKGDSDWPAVLAALDAVGYTGWFIAEQHRPEGMTDAEYLAHVSAGVDRILAL